MNTTFVTGTQVFYTLWLSLLSSLSSTIEHKRAKIASQVAGIG
jgi:hypothetical protein